MHVQGESSSPEPSESFEILLDVSATLCVQQAEAEKA